MRTGGTLIDVGVAMRSCCSKFFARTRSVASRSRVSALRDLSIRACSDATRCRHESSSVACTRGYKLCVVVMKDHRFLMRGERDTTCSFWLGRRFLSVSRTWSCSRNT